VVDAGWGLGLLAGVGISMVVGMRDGVVSGVDVGAVEWLEEDSESTSSTRMVMVKPYCYLMFLNTSTAGRAQRKIIVYHQLWSYILIMLKKKLLTFRLDMPADILNINELPILLAFLVTKLRALLCDVPDVFQSRTKFAWLEKGQSRKTTIASKFPSSIAVTLGSLLRTESSTCYAHSTHKNNDRSPLTIGESPDLHLFNLHSKLTLNLFTHLSKLTPNASF
jgi:hypothetical protein